jgi:hypothetical protein
MESSCAFESATPSHAIAAAILLPDGSRPLTEPFAPIFVEYVASEADGDV